MTREEVIAVCQVLCSSIGRPEVFWSELGGSPEAVAVSRGTSQLSQGEQLIVRLCWVLWSGEANADVGELVAVLGGWRLRLVGSLLVAMAAEDRGEALAAWVKRHTEAPYRCAACGPLYINERQAQRHVGGQHLVTRTGKAVAHG